MTDLIGKDTFELPSVKNLHAFDCELHVAIKAKDNSTIQKLLQNGDKFCVNSGYGDCFYIAKRTNDWNFVKSLFEIDPAFRKEHGHYFILECLNQPESIRYLLVEPFVEKEKYIFIKSVRYCAMNVSVPAETLKILLEKGFPLFGYGDLAHALTSICNDEPKALDSFLKFEMFLELVDNINIQILLDLLLSKNQFDQYCLLMFKELIKTNKVDVNNETIPLIQAIHLNDSGMIVECVHELVQAGARTDVKDSDGYSPLAHAAKIVDPYVCYEVTRALLEAGGTPDDKALRLLCRKQDKLIGETIKLFPENSYYTPILYKAIHEQDSDVNARDREGNTPLILASQIPDVDEALSTVRYLLHLEANPGLRNKNGDTVLHFAVVRDVNMVLDLLNSDAAPSVKNNQGETPLILASNIKNPENRLNTITTLLEQGADPDCRDANDNTPLHLAINFNNEATFGLIQLYLERGADPSAVNKNGETPLHVALKLKTNMEGIIKLLFLAGCDVNLSDKITGYTPLHLAIEYTKSEKNVEILQLLLKHGCNPTSQCFNGSTALHYACQITSEDSFWFEMINTLIEYESNPNVLNHKGENVLFDLVKSSSHFDAQILKLLVNAGADINMISLSTQKTPLLTCMSENCEIDQMEKSDQKLIGIQISEERIEICKMLLQEGADANVKDRSGFTTFTYTLDVDLLIELFNRGLNPNCVDRCNNPAALSIFLKITNNHANIPELINVMHNAGVDFSVKSVEGNTPLMLYLLPPRSTALTAIGDESNIKRQSYIVLSTIRTIGRSLFNYHKKISRRAVRALLQTNMIDLSVQNTNGETALLLIVSQSINHSQIDTSDALDNFVQILETGLNPFLDEKQNIKLIFLRAFSINHLECGPRVVRRLLDFWISSGRCNPFPLTYSCFVNAVDKVKNPEVALRNFRQLLEIGADPLVEADQIELLLERTPERSGFDVLDHVVICTVFDDRDEIVRYLLEAVERRDDYRSYCSLKWDSHAEKMLTEHNNLPCSRMARLFDRFTRLLRLRGNRMGIESLCHFRHNFGSEIESFLDRLIKYDFNEEFIHVENVSVIIAFLNADTTLFKKDFHSPVSEEFVSHLMKKLIVETGVDPCRRVLCTFKDDEIQLWNQRLQLFDALWVAAISGHTQCVCDLLPYWPAPPLALLIFMYPLSGREFSERVILNRIVTLIPVLLKCGGRLPPESPILSRIRLVIGAIINEIHRQQITRHLGTINQFTNAHNSVPRLQDLCRTTIRGTLSGGRDLPDRIATLPLPVPIIGFLNYSDSTTPAYVSYRGTV